MARPKAERERMRTTGFPKDPAECRRHRWNLVMNLRTMEPLEPRRYACWFCGTQEPTDAA